MSTRSICPLGRRLEPEPREPEKEKENDREDVCRQRFHPDLFVGNDLYVIKLRVSAFHRNSDSKDSYDRDRKRGMSRPDDRFITNLRNYREILLAGIIFGSLSRRLISPVESNTR